MRFIIGAAKKFKPAQVRLTRVGLDTSPKITKFTYVEFGQGLSKKLGPFLIYE